MSLVELVAESEPTNFRRYSPLRNQLKAQGYMSEVFTLVDATHLISKAGLYKAIELRPKSLNNKTLEKAAVDKDAKFGAKNKDKSGMDTSNIILRSSKLWSRLHR